MMTTLPHKPSRDWGEPRRPPFIVDLHRVLVGHATIMPKDALHAAAIACDNFRRKVGEHYIYGAKDGLGEFAIRLPDIQATSGGHVASFETSVCTTGPVKDTEIVSWAYFFKHRFRERCYE